MLSFLLFQYGWWLEEGLKLLGLVWLSHQFPCHQTESSDSLSSGFFLRVLGVKLWAPPQACHWMVPPLLTFDLFFVMRTALEMRLSFWSMSSWLQKVSLFILTRNQMLYVHGARTEPVSSEKCWSHVVSSPSSLLKEKQRCLFCLHLASLYLPRVQLSLLPK